MTVSVPVRLSGCHGAMLESESLIQRWPGMSRHGTRRGHITGKAVSLSARLIIFNASSDVRNRNASSRSRRVLSNVSATFLLPGLGSISFPDLCYLACDFHCHFGLRSTLLVFNPPKRGPSSWSANQGSNPGLRNTLFWNEQVEWLIMYFPRFTL